MEIRSSNIQSEESTWPFFNRKLLVYFLVFVCVATAIWFSLVPKAMMLFMPRDTTVNVFNVDESVESWIGRANYQSDFLIVNTLYEIKENGILHNQMGIGTYPGYTSQFGLGSWITSAPLTTNLIPESWFRVNMNLKPELSGYRDYSRVVKVIFVITVALNSAMISALILGIRALLGTGPAVIAAISFLNPWGTAFLSSIYSQIWIKMLPGVVIAFLGISLWKRDRKKLLYTLFYSSVLLTALSGYEYITVTFTCAIGAVLLTSSLLRESSRAVIQKTLEITTIFISAFISGVFLHVIQLRIKTGSFSTAWSMFLELVTKRAGGNITAVDSVYETSRSSNPSEILNYYLQLSPIADPFKIPLLNSFNMLAFMIVVSIVASKYGSSRFERDLGAKSVSFAWLAIALGPISWFTLSRPHSQIHTFINPWLWWIPVVPVGLALISYSIREAIFSDSKPEFSITKRRILFVMLFFPTVLIILSYSLRSMS